MLLLDAPSRLIPVSALALVGALSLSGCGLFGGSGAPTSAAPSSAPASSSAPTSAAPSSGTAAPPAGASSPGAASSWGPRSESPAGRSESSSAVASSSASSAAAGMASCSGLTGEQALRQALERGLTVDYTARPVSVDYSGYDPCAGLSAVVLTRGNGGLPGMEVQLFRHGLPVGEAPETGHHTVLPPVRVDDDTLALTFLYAKERESQAEASGRVVSHYRWDAATGKVVRTGDLPPMAGAAPAVSSRPSTSTRATASGGAATSAAGSMVALHHASDVGFCFASPTEVVCFGKANNDARLPATGAPTKREGLPATDFGPGLPSVELVPGQSRTVGPFVCTATAGGFDCTNTANGAAISVAGPTIRLTPPTR